MDVIEKPIQIGMETWQIIFSVHIYRETRNTFVCAPCDWQLKSRKTNAQNLDQLNLNYA